MTKIAAKYIPKVCLVVSLFDSIPEQLSVIRKYHAFCIAIKYFLEWIWIVYCSPFSLEKDLTE